ncbi:MAG: BrnA antitoxin family protein [Desulfuromonadales bacterium]
MKKESSENIVRVKGVPKLNEEQLTALHKLAATSDRDIDTSDIPEITDFSGFLVGKFYRPVKETVTIRLDSDVLHWLKMSGRGYQSRLNALLRKEMLTNYTQSKAA